jgi:hypothetical protein
MSGNPVNHPLERSYFASIREPQTRSYLAGKTA